MNNTEEAKRLFTGASQGLNKVSAAMFYNDQQPDTIFIRDWPFKRWDKTGEAEKRFNSLIDFGKEHLNDNVRIDYFAVSLPDLC